MKLTPTQRHVLLELQLAAQNNQANPSIKQLSTQTGLSRRTITRAINELETYGIITRIPQTDSFGGHRPNLYRINTP